ncbi:MAG: Diaminopimelate decarboxylase [Chloroflexota bacterium]
MPVAELDGCSRLAPTLRLAARRAGTPAYVVDELALAAAADELAAAFPDPWLRHHSLKANDTPAVVALLGARGVDANVVSAGEWTLARRGGIPNDRTTLEGIGKSDGDLRAAVRAAAAGEPLRWVALESPDEAGRLAALARRAGTTLDVLLRFNPDVAPETLAGLAVGSGASKFGMTEAEISAAIEAGGGPGGPLRWRGLHLHVGSQLGAVDAWREAVRRSLALVALWRGSIPAFDTLDVGGGFPVAAPGEPGPSPARFARELPALIEAIPADRRPRRLAVEPGRFLVARAGWLVGRVLHARERGGPLVVVDAGMAELIRPALYGAHHGIVALTSLGRAVDPARPDGPGGAAVPGGAASGRRPVPTRVAGPICESTDELGVHPLPPLRRGDLVAIRDAGAYGSSMSSRYNGRPRPPELIAAVDGGLRVARRRGSLASLV